MTNTTNQPDSSAASGEAPEQLLQYFVRSAYPVATEINPRGHNWCEPYLDQALAAYRASQTVDTTPAPQAATPLPEQEERAKFEKSMNDARFFPAELCFARTKSPSGRDEYANSHLQSCWVGWQARVNLTLQAAPEAPASEQQALDDTATLRRWAGQIDRIASMFNDERSLLCQQAAVLLRRITHKPDSASPAATTASASGGKEMDIWNAGAKALADSAQAPSREAAAPQVKTWQERHLANGNMGNEHKFMEDEIADLRAALAKPGAAQGGTTGKGEQHGK